MSAFDLQVPFLRPVWRRVALVAVCMGWALVEWATREPFWTMIFGALGVYAAWQLFIRPWPDESHDKAKTPAVSYTHLTLPTILLV